MKTGRLLGAFFILLLPLVWPPAASAVQVTWRWTAPATGSPPVGYELQISTNGGDWHTVATPADTFAVVEMPEGESVARVRAVDGFGRVGPWSESSEPFIDNGPPGGCGIPFWR